MPEKEEREKLANVIRRWNNNRLDLFEICQPDQNLEFHGVIRFYFEDDLEGNVATKCLRVCSSSPTRDVIKTLSEKFRPDLKMLSTSYSLYEIHTNKERKMDLDEKPLIVQLGWNSDNREGRFVLKKDEDSLEENCHEREKGGVLQTFKRTLSRKGTKKEKKQSCSAGNTSGEENGSTEDLLNNICLSNLETQKLFKTKEQQQFQTLKDHSELPVRIQISDEAEEAFLSAVINYTNSSTVHFKLSPAYILYAVSRFALQCHYSQSSPSSGGTRAPTSIANKMVAMIGKVIQRQQTIAGALSFWMANSSELLNFFKHDKDLSPLTQQSQVNLSHQVHNAYSFLLHCLQNELRKHLPTFLSDPEQHGVLPAGIEMVLNTLMNAMSLLRRCRVNPALTIQLFSQLFHFISSWLFNQLMNPETSAPGLLSHYWGSVLRQRFAPIETWAERQGLELAADCHLGHIKQATTLLSMNKYSMQDAKDMQSTCFKLNSLQLQVLLTGYLCASNEPHIPNDLIDAVIRAAEASADNLIRSEGRDIQLEESFDLHLPFLLPEGGYSCDTVKGIPPGFQEFLEPVCQKGLCSFMSQPKSRGDWTVYFSEHPHSEDTYLAVHRQPEIETITLHKPLNSGMGISIVAAKGSGQNDLGIYIKSVVRGGPADMSGRLAAGDQLLSVDGHSLVGLNQERAVAVMMQTGPVVTLQVAKFGARYHGLGALLSEQPPENTTGDEDRTKPNSKAAMVYCVVDLGPSERLLGGNKRKKSQTMQRNREPYRSNPNMTVDFCLEEVEDSTNPEVKGNITSLSSIDLCTSYHREYLTLPNPKSKDKVSSEVRRPQQTFKTYLSPSNGQSSCKRTIMRQALSQENLCVDIGGPLLDQRQNSQTLRDQTSFFPIRSSVSTHDILSRRSFPSNQHQGRGDSAADVWRTPFSQQATPTPSVQPVRIDIPVTRATNTQSNRPLTTFQQSSSFLPVKTSQALKVSELKQSPRSQVSHIHASPMSATKKQPQPSVLWQQQRSTTHGAEKPQVSITPTKHVSFQDMPSQKKTPGPTKQKEPQGLRDPWKREAQEKLEKEQRLQAVEHLERDVQQLKAKDKRTAEENDRLRRLNLEWQFQKRLREIQQRGDEEEEDEDLDMTVILQQLGNKTSKAENTSSSGGNDHWGQNEEKKTGNRLSHKEDEAKIGQRENLRHDDNLIPREDQEEKIKRESAPEKLTFRERQRLFTLASSA